MNMMKSWTLKGFFVGFVIFMIGGFISRSLGYEPPKEIWSWEYLGYFVNMSFFYLGLVVWNKIDAIEAEKRKNA